MQYVITPYAEASQPFVWWDGAFTDQELDVLQQKAKDAAFQAQVGGISGQEDLAAVRRSKIAWLENNQDTEWVFRKLAHVVSSLNSQFYRFDITGFGEPLQLTNYDQSNHGMYQWHLDCGGSRIASRKLSLVVQLTDPSQYEGGNLQIMTTGNPETVKKQRGLIVAFPSYVLHQVTPVTQGSRQSLVAWASGPAFK